MESIERPECRQGAHAYAVPEENLRGPLYPSVRIPETLPPRSYQVLDTLAGTFQRHRSDQQRAHYQVRKHRYEPHDLYRQYPFTVVKTFHTFLFDVSLNYYTFPL